MVKTYDTVNGKWWLLEDGKQVRKLSDNETAQVIWGTNNSVSQCPFCLEIGDFDLIGLKYHLINHCPVFSEVISPNEESARNLARDEY